MTGSRQLPFTGQALWTRGSPPMRAANRSQLASSEVLLDRFFDEKYWVTAVNLIL